MKKDLSVAEREGEREEREGEQEEKRVNSNEALTLSRWFHTEEKTLCLAAGGFISFNYLSAYKLSVESWYQTDTALSYFDLGSGSG